MYNVCSRTVAYYYYDYLCIVSGLVAEDRLVVYVFSVLCVVAGSVETLWV